MVLPSASGRAATSRAALTLAPAEMPPRMPSFAASSRDTAMASSLVTVRTSSRVSWSSTSGMKLAPRPWILCGPALPSVSSGDAAGSTATSLTSALCFFSVRPAPVMVPPVPMPATK